MWNRWKPVFSVAVVAVLAVNTTAFGHRHCGDAVTLEVGLPGVDPNGNLSTDPSVAGTGFAKIFISGKSSCATVIARGSVGNESGTRQCYRNLLSGGGYADYQTQGITIKSDRYTVSQSGGAWYCGYGKVIQNNP